MKQWNEQCTRIFPIRNMKKAILLILCLFIGGCYYTLVTMSDGIIIHQNTIRYDSLNKAICDVEVVWNVEHEKYWAKRPLTKLVAELEKNERREVTKDMVKWAGAKEWSGRVNISKYEFYFTDTGVVTIDSIWKEPAKGYYATLWLGIKSDGPAKLCAESGDTLYCEELEIKNGIIRQKSYGKITGRNKTIMQIYRNPQF